MRVAMVHDWLVTYGGAERLFEQMLNCYPNSDLFSLINFISEDQRNFIKNKPVKTSFIQKLPFAKTKYRQYLPFMPIAIEQFDVSKYDVVISNNFAVAKGVITGPDQLHICMCCSPIRYAWDLQHQYLNESGLSRGIKGAIARIILHYIRLWDYRTSSGVDEFIAISKFIARRINKLYKRDATVIYPPVDIDGFNFYDGLREDYYLTASRMVPYKKMDLIVEAFSAMPDKNLVVIGDGPDFEKIKSKAEKNVKLLGYQPFDVLKYHLQRAKGFVFASEEDFGIAPIEAQACGTPVIAYGKGAALETILGVDNQNPTGIFFNSQEISSLKLAVQKFETMKNIFTPTACRSNALRFSSVRFHEEFKAFVEKKYASFMDYRER